MAQTQVSGYRLSGSTTLKSPLSKHALPLEAMRVGKKFAYIEFNADGSLADSIVAAGLHIVKIDEITSDHLVVTTRIGWTDHLPLTKYGLVPDESGAWSTQYCMVKSKVAVRLMREYSTDRDNSVPPEDRGGKARQVSGYAPR